MTTFGTDNFTRANSTGFGLASDGVNTWSSADFGSDTTNITSNQGEFTGGTSITACHLGTTTSLDGHVLATFSASSLTSGYAMVFLRQSAANTYYRARQTSSALFIDRVNAGTATQLGTVSFTASAATKYNLRFEIVGGVTPTFRANVWATGSVEPSWLLGGGGTSVITDSTPITSAGSCGIGAKPNSSGSTVDFTYFWAVDYLFVESLSASDNFLGTSDPTPGFVETATASDSLLGGGNTSPGFVETLSVTDTSLTLTFSLLNESVPASDNFLNLDNTAPGWVESLAIADLSSSLQSWMVDSLVVADSFLGTSDPTSGWIETLPVADTFLALDRLTRLELLSASDSFFGTPLPLFIESVPASDSLLYLDDTTPGFVETLMVADLSSSLQSWTVDSLVASDSFSTIVSTAPGMVESLIASDTLLAQESLSLVESLVVSDSFLRFALPLLVESLTSTDSFLALDRLTRVESLSASDTFLPMNIFGALESYPAGDTFLYIHTIPPPPPPSQIEDTRVALPWWQIYGGANVLPLTPSIKQPYLVNGVVLATQPSMATTPQTVAGNTILAGSLFTLFFLSPDSATQTALANGSMVTMTFPTAASAMATGQVQVASSLAAGLFQVTLTTMTNIQFSMRVMITPFF